MTIVAQVKYLDDGDYRWNSYYHTIVERVVGSNNVNDDDSEGDCYYGEDVYEGKTLFKITETDTCTCISLSGTKDCKLATLTTFDVMVCYLRCPETILDLDS